MIARVRLAQDPDILQERRADRRSRPERLEQKDRVYAFFRKWVCRHGTRQPEGGVLLLRRNDPVRNADRHPKP